MFKKTLCLYERTKVKYPLFYKRLLKNVEDDKRNKKELILHCFYNRHCNIPIPINDIMKDSKKNMNTTTNETNNEPTVKTDDEAVSDVEIDSPFVPNILQVFYDTSKDQTTTIDFTKASKDKNFKEQLEKIKKGKFTKIEFLMNNKKYTPFKFKEPFNKEDYLKELKLISHFQKTLRETSPYIDSSEVNELNKESENKLDDDDNNNKTDDIEMQEVVPPKENLATEAKNKYPHLPSYSRKRSSIRARESLKRFLKKKNIQKSDINKYMIMKQPDRSNNDFYKIHNKNIILWKHSRDKKKLHFSLGKLE